MAHNQDNDNLSDDVFEDAEETQRRAEEKRRRNEEYDHVPPRNLTTYVDASGSVITDYNVPHQNYHQHLHQQGDGASTSQQHHHNHRREPLQLYAYGEAGYQLNEHHDDWRSYRYEEVGMHPAPQPQPPQPFDDTVSHKTILLGDSGVGKTSFLVKYNTGEFRLGSFSATVGIALTNKIVVVDGTRVKLQIWDTAGQERFRSVTHAYYRDAHALLLLYDVTNRTTFDNIRAWLGEIRYYAQEDVVILLIGNKADCSNSERQVKREDGERLAAENNVPFMETSAKSGQNVELSFTAVARQLKNGGYRAGTEGQFNVHDFVRNNSNAPSMCEQCRAL